MNFERSGQTVSRCATLTAATLSAQVTQGSDPASIDGSIHLGVKSPRAVLDPALMQLVDAVLSARRAAGMHPPPHGSADQGLSKASLFSAQQLGPTQHQAPLTAISQLQIQLTVQVTDVFLAAQLPAQTSDAPDSAAELPVFCASIETVAATAQIRSALVALSPESIGLAPAVILDLMDVLPSTLSVQLSGFTLGAQKAHRGEALSATPALLNRLVTCTRASADCSLRYASRLLSVQTVFDLGSIDADLSWLAVNSSLDYFAVMVVLRSLVDSRASMSHQEAVPDSMQPGATARFSTASVLAAAAASHIELAWTAQLAAESLRLVLVGHAGKCGLLASMSSLAVSTIVNKAPGRTATLAPPKGSVQLIRVADFSNFTNIEQLSTSAFDVRDVLKLAGIIIGPNPAAACGTHATPLLEFQTVHILVSSASVRFALVDLFCAIHACVDLVKIATLFAKSKPSRPGTPASPHSAQATPIVHIGLTAISLDVELPQSVQMRGSILDVAVSLFIGGVARSTFASLFAEVLSPAEGAFRRIAQMNALRFELAPRSSVRPQLVDIGAASAELTVPHGFEMSDIVENGINLFRAVKQLLGQALGLLSSNSSPSGRTVVDVERIPEIRVTVERCWVRIEDDPFVSQLSFNYRTGFVENANRIARERLFWKRQKAER
nr:hypothetical protein HK105_003575 [Polyrhizophydium stewartii]